jgi:glycosyltransferase involved in cell wall biosynthesis
VSRPLRITIVCGFFLPVPPVQGGSTEKSWYQLARRFAARGHAVTIVSRRWPGWADDETVEGIRHLRLRGFNHRPQLWRNLLLDFIWSWRVFFALPSADIAIVNAVTLPAWLGLLQPGAGRVVLLCGRMPKGQYRRYRRVARVLVPSRPVLDRLLAENPALASVCRISGYPLDTQVLRRGAPAEHPGVTIGFVGRLHREKGLGLLADALKLVAATPGLPRWRVVLCGPDDIARGGAGPEFRAELGRALSSALPPEAVSILAPQFGDTALARVYQSIDIFCYPSQAEEGETFGVAVTESMAAGAVPVVSALACFSDIVRDGDNGLVFDHRAADAPARLAAALVGLLQDPARRRALAAAALATVHRYDYEVYADWLLADFEQLTGPEQLPSSLP